MISSFISFYQEPVYQEQKAPSPSSKLGTQTHTDTHREGSDPDPVEFYNWNFNRKSPFFVFKDAYVS